MPQQPAVAPVTLCFHTLDGADVVWPVVLAMRMTVDPDEDATGQWLLHLRALDGSLHGRLYHGTQAECLAQRAAIETTLGDLVIHYP